MLTKVSEIAGRALRVVWRQKWLIHRRLRPGAYGGLLHCQVNGVNGTTRSYGLPLAASQTQASQLLQQRHHTLLLPIAFSAGSPPHPAYGAGHATVAGACITTLKALFDGTTKMSTLLSPTSTIAPAELANPTHPIASNPADLANPRYAVISEADASGSLQPYTAADAAQMTVEGELNKIAANVAMGRSMGGVHFRTDNTRSLRLGEQLALEILRKESAEYTEQFQATPAGGARNPVSFQFRSFSGRDILVTGGSVFVDGQLRSPMAGPIV